MIIFLSTTTQMGSNSSGWAIGLQSESKCCLARTVTTKSKLEPREKCNSSCMARHRGQLAASPVHLSLSPKSLLTQTSFTLQKKSLGCGQRWLSLIYFMCDTVMPGVCNVKNCTVIYILYLMITLRHNSDPVRTGWRKWQVFRTYFFPTHSFWKNHSGGIILL